LRRAQITDDPPDARRTCFVYVRDVPVEQRLNAARQAAKSARDNAERYKLIALALEPGDLGAWVAP
jgi:hypothetical protein